MNSRRVKLMISGIGLKKKFELNNVRTVSQLTLPLPITAPDVLKTRYKHLRDVDFPNEPVARPNILIGLEHAKLGLMYEIREGKWNEPVASRTRLGWVIHGKEDGRESQNFSCHVCECNNSDLHNLMRDFFTTESFGVKAVNQLLEAKDDIRARAILRATTNKIGVQYETGLLWRKDDVQLPESKRMADKRLQCFEQKLNRDEQLKEVVRAKMSDHISKGYLVKLSAEEVVNVHRSRHWYLPVFSIQNVNKPGKLRLVFDAAAKSNGVSLNDMLLKGPEMIVSLFGIIMRFRLRQFAVSADIAEMFHRVRIVPEDQLCQLILWRDCDNSKASEVYKMTVMTFGATCSPCSAHHVKNENARRFSSTQPRAVEAIIRNHYVDDLLDCFDTEEEALHVGRQIQAIHAEAGFNIRNWRSNSKLVNEKMNSQADDKKPEINMNVSDEVPTETILGMFWSVEDDEFVFKVSVNRVSPDIIAKVKIPSKREVLRMIMSQFDPLGMLSTIIIFGKILMQELWRSGIEWEDKIPTELQQKWFDWLDALHGITKLRVPRCYFPSSKGAGSKENTVLFADASEEAFVAVGYLQRTFSDDICVSFVSGKSRVAPQKALSIPRLELQAAVLATRLKETIIAELAIPFLDVVLWSDSQTVLGWIRSTTRKYSSFVSHRVSEILDSTTVLQWRWLPSRENVADEATRSIEIPVVSERWLNGPEFLRRDAEFWPVEKEKIVSTNEEVKMVGVHENKRKKSNFVNLERFSKWERLLRCTAFVIRYIDILRRRVKEKLKYVTEKNLSIADLVKRIPAVTANELKQGEHLLYKMSQADDYASEITKLSTSGKYVSRHSKIYNLNPILGDDGLLRLAGRLDTAPAIVSNELRRPIILNREHKITSLLIDAVHRKFHHLNKECVVNQLRQYVWIPKIRVQVNKVVKDCNFCKIRAAKPKVPRMSALPDERLAPNQPVFSFTGIDFFGPIEVTIGRRHEKRWGVVFVCLTSRAIHIELAASLDTNSAIMCIRNFINRRGPPIKFFSDNGTNLRAAEKELKSAVREIDVNQLQNESVLLSPNEIRTEWTFIPPGAPHFGGSWERMIQIVKKSLYTILKHKYPKEEVLRSALIEIENLVNSRPLNYTPNDDQNLEAITPNHLLKGSNRTITPLTGEYDSRKQWRVAQSLATEFWNRWLFEYLPTISRRPKWIDDVEPVHVGQLVLIIDENIRRGDWLKGLVSKVYPSKDGRIRTAEVRTARGTHVRPVS